MDPIHLEEGERIILKTRKHAIILLRDTLGTAIVGVLPFLAFAGLLTARLVPQSVFAFSDYLLFAAALWFLVIWMTLCVLWTNHYLDIWIVTNRRIFNVEQDGLFQRRVATWSLESVQEITVSSDNFMQHLFGYGTIEVETAGPSDSNATAEGLPHPDRIRAVILHQIGRIGALEETTKRQEGLIHTISHEVKGYLAKDEAALAGIIEGDYGSVPEKLKTVADTALSETRKGVSTVMNVLEGASAAEGTIAIERKPFDVKVAAQTVVEQLRRSAEARALQLEFVASGGSFMVEGDETKMRELVFRNLVDNAIRYTPQGSVHVVVTSLGTRVLFGVKDTGIGITETDKKRLFTQGGHGEDSKTHNPDSTGYGLFIAKQIVDAHGGKIWATSEGRKKGALFLVELPAVTESV